MPSCAHQNYRDTPALVFASAHARGFLATNQGELVKWYPYGVSWYYGPHLQPSNAVASVHPEWESRDPDKGIARPARYVVRIRGLRVDTRQSVAAGTKRAMELLKTINIQG